MKIGGITLKQIDSGQVLRAAGCGVAGFLAAGCCLDGRAPLTAGFLAACQPGKNAAAALCGGMLGAFAFLDFGPALRCCGILALVYTAVLPTLPVSNQTHGCKSSLGASELHEVRC